MLRDKLYWNTVSNSLETILKKLMDSPVFEQFRLVGGTSLSLQLGHRMSVDIDLFTDALYNSINFTAIDDFLRNTFLFVSGPGPGPIALGASYLIGEDEQNCVKLDLYYTDTFIQQPIIVEHIRMATIEEITAMKIEIIQTGGRKKDYWDIYEILDTVTPLQILELHKTRHPYTHNQDLIIDNFLNFDKADDDFEPICLRGNYWEIIKLELATIWNKLK